MPTSIVSQMTPLLNLQAEPCLRGLLSGDLEFHEQPSDQDSHALHAFPAKFPPQLPRQFISQLTQPGEVVLDPMVGSGTTAVAALALGRNAIASDLDPLARLITQVKTAPLCPRTAWAAGQEVIERAERAMRKPQLLQHALRARLDAETLAFVEYWFLPQTRCELTALVQAIEAVADRAIRRFLQLVLSSIIVTKSGGVSRARDLAHTRPWRDVTKQPKSAVAEFRKRLARVTPQLQHSRAAVGQTGERSTSVCAQVLAADCRALPLTSESVDLIITSPPYAVNAIDYMRASKFSLVWLGMSIREGRELRSRYIGSDRRRDAGHHDLPRQTTAVVAEVARADPQKASTLARYFDEMTDSLAEMARVLKPGACAIVVVGPSTLRGIRVDTQECLAEIGSAVGLTCVGIGRRRLDRDRRMMPARWGGPGESMIEQRMHEEFVLGFVTR